MGRSGMDLKQFNEFMKRCSKVYGVRYVTPTIHPRFRIVVSITIHTAGESTEFTTTNNPDVNFDLNVAVNKFLDGLEGKVTTSDITVDDGTPIFIVKSPFNEYME